MEWCSIYSQDYKNNYSWPYCEITFGDNAWFWRGKVSKSRWKYLGSTVSNPEEAWWWWRDWWWFYVINERVVSVLPWKWFSRNCMTLCEEAQGIRLRISHFHSRFIKSLFKINFMGNSIYRRGPTLADWIQRGVLESHPHSPHHGLTDQESRSGWSTIWKPVLPTQRVTVPKNLQNQREPLLSLQWLLKILLLAAFGEILIIYIFGSFLVVPFPGSTADKADRLWELWLKRK